MNRTLTGRSERQMTRILRFRKSVARRAQSMRQADHYWRNSDWNKCLRLSTGTEQVTLIHKGRKPRTRRFYGPLD